MIQFLAIFSNIIISILYLILGILILPRLLIYSPKRSVQLTTRISLAVFAAGCAFTHLALAIHAYEGVLSQTELTFYFVVAVPQIIGGFLFWVIALFYQDGGTIWKS